MLMIKKSCNLTGKRYKWQQPTKNGSLRSQLPLMTISMQKSEKSHFFSPERMMIKEFCNLTGREATICLATLNQKWQSQMLPSLDSYKIYIAKIFIRAIKI